MIAGKACRSRRSRDNVTSCARVFVLNIVPVQEPIVARYYLERKLYFTHAVVTLYLDRLLHAFPVIILEKKLFRAYVKKDGTI